MTWRSVLIVWFVAMGLPAFADMSLLDFDGRWSGEGQIVPGLDQALQECRCTATVQADQTGHALEIRGRCAVVAGSARFVLRLVQDGGGRVRAATSIQGLDGIQQYAGSETGTRMELDIAAPFEMSGREFISTFSIEFHSMDHFSIVEMNSDVDEAQWRVVMDLDFTREGDRN